MRTCPLCGNSTHALSGNGVCVSCEQGIQRIVVPRMRQLSEAMDVVATTDDEDTKRGQIDLILEIAKELLDHERAGVPTCNPLPSELLKTYSARLDAMKPEDPEEAVGEQRITFCLHCGEMVVWGTPVCPHCGKSPVPGEAPGAQPQRPADAGS